MTDENFGRLLKITLALKQRIHQYYWYYEPAVLMEMQNRGINKTAVGKFTFKNRTSSRCEHCGEGGQPYLSIKFNEEDKDAKPLAKV